MTENGNDGAPGILAAGREGRRAVTRPIFVIGKNRSGTKWLSNILSSHPDVVSVQREGAGGIVETNLLLNFPAVFGDLRRPENYCAMAAAFSKSNFFRCTGLPEKILFHRQFDDYADFFRHVMHSFARRCAKRFWLQKADVLVLPMLYEAFPDARFVLIERNILDNIRSSVALARLASNRKASVLKEVALYQLASRTARRFAKRPRVLRITYEALEAHREEITRRACDHLGLSYSPHMLEDRFERNTSFRNGIRRDEMLSWLDITCIRILGPLFRLIPLPALSALRRWLGSARDPRRSRFVPKSYSILRKEYGWPEEN
ncbi:MAG: sulfotransferase [Planctomycetota bacterium]